MYKEEIVWALSEEYIFAGNEMLTVSEYYQRIVERNGIRENRQQVKSSKGKIRYILKRWEMGIPVSGHLREVTKGPRYNPRGRYDFRVGAVRHNDDCYSLHRR